MFLKQMSTLRTNGPGTAVQTEEQLKAGGDIRVRDSNNGSVRHPAGLMDWLPDAVRTVARQFVARRGTSAFRQTGPVSVDLDRLLEVAEDSPPQDASKAAADRYRVHVWLFGSLSMISAERHLVFDVPDGARVAWIVEALGQRLGCRLVNQIMETPDRKFGVCRIFFNGVQVELEDELAPQGAQGSDIEIIVLTALEGG